MPNKNYLKGVRKERREVNKARSRGLVSLRSAGSHSPIDVVVIDHYRHVIKLIQCKPDDMSFNDKQKILNDYIFLNGRYTCEFIVR